MTETTPQTGAVATSGTNGKRRRILKGAAAVVPMIVTMRSSTGWAASSCGEELSADPKSSMANERFETEQDLINTFGDRIAANPYEVRNENNEVIGFMVSSQCRSSFGGA